MEGTSMGILSVWLSRWKNACDFLVYGIISFYILLNCDKYICELYSTFQIRTGKFKERMKTGKFEEISKNNQKQQNTIRHWWIE